MPLVCSVCLENFVPQKRLRINCIQCKNYICSDCFLEILTSCNNFCHATYVCPVCRTTINVSKTFVETLVDRLPYKELFEIKGVDRNVMIRITRDPTTGKVTWSKRNHLNPLKFIY